MPLWQNLCHDFTLTGCHSAVILNRVVITLFSAERSMMLLSAVKHDGYCFALDSRWQESCLFFEDTLCSKKLSSCQSCPLFALVFFSWNPVILNLPLPDAYSFSLLYQIVRLRILVMCLSLHWRTSCSKWKSERTKLTVHSLYVLAGMSLESIIIVLFIVWVWQLLKKFKKTKMVPGEKSADVLFICGMSCIIFSKLLATGVSSAVLWTLYVKLVAIQPDHFASSQRAQ